MSEKTPKPTKRSKDSPPRSISGRLVTGGIFVMALAAAVAAFSFHYMTGHRTVEFWGREPATLITNAPRVELLEMTPESVTEGKHVDEIVRFSQTSWAIVGRKEVAHSRGFSNVRHYLMQSPDFDWDTEPVKSPDWRWALRFYAAEHSVTVLFAPTTATIGLLESGKRATLDPGFAQNLENFCQENSSAP